MMRMGLGWGVTNLNVIIRMEDAGSWPGEPPDGVRRQDLGVLGRG